LLTDDKNSQQMQNPRGGFRWRAQRCPEKAVGWALCT